MVAANAGEARRTVVAPTTAACEDGDRGAGSFGVSLQEAGDTATSSIARRGRAGTRGRERAARAGTRANASGDRETSARIGRARDRARRGDRAGRTAASGSRHRTRDRFSLAPRVVFIAGDAHLLEAVEGGDGGDGRLLGDGHGGLDGDGGAEEGGGHGGHCIRVRVS